MEIAWISTHLVMAICMFSILYFSLKPDEEVNEPKKISATTQFYTHGVKLIKVMATTGSKIAASVLMSYLK